MLTHVIKKERYIEYVCVVPDKNDVVDWHVVMKFIGML